MITYSSMAWGDLMCAQLGHLASLYYLARENGQEIILYRELENFRAGFRFPDAFDIDFVHYLERAGSLKKAILHLYGKATRKKTWQKRMKRSGNQGFPLFCDRVIYKWIRMSYRDFAITNSGVKNDVHSDPALLTLGNTGCYDILGGYGTYQDWKKYEDEILDRIRFKEEVVKQGEAIWKTLTSPKKKISIHLRRTDYLLVFPFHLDDAYYRKAMSLFEEEDVQFLIFSDDIPACREMELFKGRDAVFMEANPGPVDLYLMSKCDGNIIANSTFSFWGAFLNRNREKKVVCSRTFVGDHAPEFAYLNGNYYPSSWIAL